MLRKFGLIVISALVLVGCGKDDDEQNVVHMDMARPSFAPPYVPSPDIVIQTDAPNPNALFSLTHALTIEMAREAVTARFQRAQDACLKNKALKCVLVSASITAAQTVQASIQVALPHDNVAAYEKTIGAKLVEDGDQDPTITSRSTSTENQTAQSADADRQLAQAIAFRDKLENLAKREGLTVDEVIKIHEQLKEAQSAVETAAAAKRAIDSDVHLETVSLTLQERVAPENPSAFAHFWSKARTVLATSTALMLLRLINVLPWLPLALLVAWLVARFVKRIKIVRRTKE